MPTMIAADETHRTAILDAALGCFLEKGVAGTAISELRTVSGASVGCIYHHFGSKEHLAAVLYVQTLSEYYDMFLASVRSASSARAGVEGAVHGHLAWVAERPDHASYLFHCREPEVVDASETAIEQLNASFFGEVAAWLADHVSEGRIRSLPPELYYALWMGPSLEYARQWLAGRRRQSDLLTGGRTLAKAAWDSLKVSR